MTRQPSLLDTLVKVEKWMKEMIEDAGGCDHSVGICWCGDYRLLEELTNTIKQLRMRAGVAQ